MTTATEVSWRRVQCRYEPPVIGSVRTHFEDVSARVGQRRRRRLRLALAHRPAQIAGGVDEVDVLQLLGARVDGTDGNVGRCSPTRCAPSQNCATAHPGGLTDTQPAQAVSSGKRVPVRLLIDTRIVHGVAGTARRTDDWRSMGPHQGRGCPPLPVR
jgi:hypothetical protein